MVTSMEQNKLTSEQSKAFYAAFVGWIFDYYELFLLSFVVIPMSKELSLSTNQVASLFSIQLAFIALGGIIFGILGDRIGRTKVLMYTILLFAIGTLMRAFTFDYTWLVCWTIVTGFGLGGEYGVGQALVSEVVPPQKRGFWSGMLYSGAFFGIAGGAVVSAYVLPNVGWRWTLIISAIPAFVALFIRKYVKESEMWKSNTKDHKKSPRKQLGAKQFWFPLCLAIFASTIQFFAYYGITSFLPTYLVKYEQFSMGKAAWWSFFTAFAGFVGTFLGAITADRWGRRLTLSLMALAAAIGGTWLFLSWKSLIHSYWILIPFFVLYLGSAASSVFGSLFSELFPTHLRSTGVSSALQIGRGLSFIPPLISAAVFPVYGYKPIILGGAALFLVLSLWAWVFPETKNVNLEEELDLESDSDATKSKTTSSSI
jgi:MFS family permease